MVCCILLISLFILIYSIIYYFDECSNSINENHNEYKCLCKEKFTENNNQIEISDFVKSMSSNINLPADYDYKKERTNYLDKKHK
jgi:hypothetical protein